MEITLLLKLAGGLIGLIIAAIYAAPYIPVVGPIIISLSKGKTALQKAFPQLANEKWWQNTVRVVDVLEDAMEVVQIVEAEVDKEKDPDGSIRRGKVKSRLRELYGIEEEWDATTNAAVDQLIDIALSKKGLLKESLLKGQMSPFPLEGSVSANSSE